jgi:beta-glucosidase
MFKNGKSGDLALMRRLKADGIPVVAVFLSGRPLWLNREINAADAFVAAWLPGSEGEAWPMCCCAGRWPRAHDFRGKLSYSWPRRASQYRTTWGRRTTTRVRLRIRPDHADKSACAFRGPRH